MGRIIKNGLMSLMAIAAVMAMSMASPVSAQTCPGPLPPAFPTELDVNLLNSDGSNIDTSLPLTIDYLDSNGCPLYLSSVEGTVDWGIWLGKSNAYALVPALDGTNINITVEGYEILQIPALGNSVVVGDYNLVNFPPHRTKLEYTNVSINKNWNINITWADATGVDTAWLVRSDTGLKKYFSDRNVTNGNEIEFFWNGYTEMQAGEITVTAYANDTKGNTNQTSFTYQVIDTTQIDLKIPEQGGYYNTPVLINGSVVTSTTANVSYILNNGARVPIDNNTTSFSISINETDGIEPGKWNNLTVYAVNYYDENDNSTENRSFYVDVTPPSVSYNPGTTPPGAYNTQNGIFVNVSAGDDQGIKPGTLVLDFNGTSKTSWKYSGTDYWINVTDDAEGEYNILVSVEDRAGNVNRTDPIIVAIDRTAPDIIVTSPSGIPISGESALLTYLVSDATTSVNWSGYSLDGKANKTVNLINDGNYTYAFDGLPDGLHTITVYANDTAGNMNRTTKHFRMDNGILGSSNGSIDDKGSFICSSTYDSRECSIDIVNITGNVTGSVNVTRFDERRFGRTPIEIKRLDQSTGLPGGYTASGIYIRINHTPNLTGNFSALLRIYYNVTTDLPGDVDLNTLKIYRYNKSSETWDGLNSTVNTTGGIPGYDGYIETTVTNFSYFSFGGMLIPPKKEPRGSNPYRPYVPRSVPTVILTASNGWHYAMLATGFVVANDYVLLVTPSDTLDLAIKNNIQWFRRLIILGGESIISKDIEDNFTYLKESLEPGFFGMDVIRVNGTNYFDTSAMLVDLWKDSEGNSTAKGIILTRGDVFADTLVASQLSAATSSPIIFTTPTRLLPWARDKIRELGLGVTIIGGEEAISSEVEEAVKALGVNVTRIGGKDRYETAALVAEEYVKAMEEKGRTVDTITFLSGDAGYWANTLGFRSYIYNSTILYVRPINDSSPFPIPNKNFINAHPEIAYASIMTENNTESQGYSFDDSYIRSTRLEVDRSIWKFYMDIDQDKKNYTLDTNAVKLSITTSQKVISWLRKAGILILYGSGEGGKSVKGTGDAGGSGGPCCL